MDPYQQAIPAYHTFKNLHAGLDFARLSEQKQFQVFRVDDNFYAAWRARTAGNFLHEENFPAERLLQAIWQHQRLQRDALRTADGRVVRVFHPGFASVEGGPDFRQALVQIGDEPPRSGDIEIDLHPGGWRAHGHDRNVHFKDVLLHVVWAGGRAEAGAPTIVALKDLLDAPLAELSSSLENASLRSLPEDFRGKCFAPLREKDQERLGELFRAAARVRFENKAAQLRIRARSVGWEQALWEALFRALGYKHNPWPMQNLAETRSQWSAGLRSAFDFQARLLGTSGLLPDQLTRAQSADRYLRRLWDAWWRDREEFSGCILPRAAWRFHGLRPANHPQRRLALASHWLADPRFITRLEQWGTSAPRSDRASIDSLRRLLQVETDEFWSWHWTFRSARMKKPQPLLGDARLTDLAVNVILPWLWVRGAAGGNERIQREIERRYFAWPAAEDNAVLKLARQRLLGRSKAEGLDTAAAQQGLMQIVRDFCEHSNAVCDHCPFPELVRDWDRPA